MSSKRWLAPWKDSAEKPAIYHCISRVVDRRFVLEQTEREKFRAFMRMQENFSGCSTTISQTNCINSPCDMD
jgi:hypothetical protein